MRIPTLLFALLPLAAGTAFAQRARGPAGNTPAAIRRAAETITESDVRGRIGVLAHDSMRGRDTPSPELEEVAAWIAAEFRRFGLHPGGDNGSYLQRYTMRNTVLDSAAFVMAAGRGAHLHLGVGRDIAYLGALGGAPTEQLVRGPIILTAGVPTDTANPFGDVALRGAVVVQVLGVGRVNAPLVARARAAGARAWMIVQNLPPAVLAAQGRGAFRPSLRLAGAGEPRGLPVFLTRDSTALDLFRAAGEDLAALRAGGWTVRPLAGIEGTFHLPRRALEEATAPNVIGVLEGSDPVLRNEYVFFTAHMDHEGVTGVGWGECRAAGADSVCNGADDDASGTAGVVELAEAFASLPVRPRRSLVFMTVSGEEKGLWGSRFYSENPTLPLAQTVAAINLDMIGRNWRDTISVIGKEHSTLGELANRISREHPELNMSLVDDLWPSENFYFRSDHYNFARRGVPILFFFNGTHEDYHRPSDTVDRIDAEKESRVLRMVFYLGLEVANATERPRWNPDSYRRIVEDPPR